MTTDNELHTLLLDSLNGFCRDWREHHPFAQAAIADTPPRPDTALWQQLAELGWLGLALPEYLGGSGLGLDEAALIAGGLGRWLIPAPFVANALMPAILLAQCGESALAGQLAERLAGGATMISLAWQEHIGQLDPVAGATRYRDGDLHGRKVAVADVAGDGIVLVLADDGDGQPVLAAIAADARGVAVDRAPAGSGSLATITFSDAPALGILSRGETATQALAVALAAGRIALCAWLAGAAASCLDKTLTHLRDRQQFGKPLGSFQALRHRCADLHIQLELANAGWRHALARYADAPLAADTLTAIAAAKARGADAALRVVREAIQMHGAMGFVEEGGVGHHLRAALFGAAWLGSARRHRRGFIAAQDFHGQGRHDSHRNDRVANAASSAPATHVTPGENVDGLPDDEFRQRFRAFLDAHYPTHLRQDYLRPFRRMNGAETREWMRLVHQCGWRAPEWPREYGGLGLSFRKQRIYNEEMERIGVARMIDNGVTQLGPTLMKHGTEEQKRRYLPRILACEDYWAQGYSEPNAGSDLASLRTSAVREGEHFIVNGQKIWTTLAMEATHLYALVRTGNYGRKQQGISFLLIDLTLPGVEIRPIRHIAGEEELCEVFFSDVKVPAANLVGPLDEGWTVAKALLGHERIWLASPNLATKAMMLARQLVVETGGDRDQAVLDRLAQLAADLHDYRQWYEAICQRVESGEEIGPEASALKIYITELTQRITEFNLDIGDELGAITGQVKVGAIATDLYWQLAMSRPGTIYAGCNEVQRDILAKNVLGLRAEA